MEQSKSVETGRRSRHKARRSNHSHKLNIPSLGTNQKHLRNKTRNTYTQRSKSAADQKNRSWFNKTNAHSPVRQHIQQSTSYGYIQSLPDRHNHGQIYHPQYGKIVFTYKQALETARNHKQVRNHSSNGYMSESESFSIHEHTHLDLPFHTNRYSRSPSREYRKYSDYNSQRSRSPSPAPMSHSHSDRGLSDINRLYVYQPVMFQLSNNECMPNDTHSPLCNIETTEDSDEVLIEYNVISEGKYKRNIVKQSKKQRKHVFNDGDDTEPEMEMDTNDTVNVYKSQRNSRRSRYKQQKQSKLGPRPTKPVPKPPKRHSNKPVKKQLTLDLLDTNVNNTSEIGSPTLAESRSVFRSKSRGKSRHRSGKKIACNVKVVSVVQNDDCSLYCFSPKGKHYKALSLDQSIIKSGNESDNILNLPATIDAKRNKKQRKKSKHVLYEIDIQPRVNKNRDTHVQKRHSKNRLKMPKFPKLRKKHSSDSLSEKLTTPFCPSMSQYYVRQACLLPWEGKSVEEIRQNGMKKCVTKKLFATDNIGENVFLEGMTDLESMCDELEAKINRLFNNNGGTIYIGIKSEKCKSKPQLNKYSKSSSFTFHRNGHNSVSPFASVKDHIIVGVKLNSKMRYKLKTVIVNDILKGFTPQIPHLLHNFEMKFIPVISQSGKIISRYFVVKIGVVAPILGVNGEKMQFRTKDGYAHVVDF